MAKLIDDEFMQQVMTEQAWKNLSEEFTWTEALLEKYADKVDWKEISDNCNMIWIGRSFLSIHVKSGLRRLILKRSKINGIGLKLFQISNSQKH